MGLASNTIVLIELAHADQVIKVPIPRKTTEFTIHKLFLDPSGRHLVITSQQGENWYLYKVCNFLWLAGGDASYGIQHGQTICGDCGAHMLLLLCV